MYSCCRKRLRVPPHRLLGLLVRWGQIRRRRGVDSVCRPMLWTFSFAPVDAPGQAALGGSQVCPSDAVLLGAFCASTRTGSRVPDAARPRDHAGSSSLHLQALCLRNFKTSRPHVTPKALWKRGHAAVECDEDRASRVDRASGAHCGHGLGSAPATSGITPLYSCTTERPATYKLPLPSRCIPPANGRPVPNARKRSYRESKRFTIAPLSLTASFRWVERPRRAAPARPRRQIARRRAAVPLDLRPPQAPGAGRNRSLGSMAIGRPDIPRRWARHPRCSKRIAQRAERPWSNLRMRAFASRVPGRCARDRGVALAGRTERIGVAALAKRGRIS